MLCRYIHSIKRQTLANKCWQKIESWRYLIFSTYVTYIIPAVASRACYKLPLKYTRVTSLVLYINKISLSFCLFVCLFVCPQTTPREINMFRWIIHRWMRAFPGNNVIYFTTGYDYLVRRYTKKTDFELLLYFPIDS